MKRFSQWALGVIVALLAIGTLVEKHNNGVVRGYWNTPLAYRAAYVARLSDDDKMAVIENLWEHREFPLMAREDRNILATLPRRW